MGMSFLKGVPALMIDSERIIALGDLHIGIEDTFSGSGVSFPNAAAAMGLEIRRIYEENNANGIVFLGDVKHRLANLTKEDAGSFREFFGKLDGIDVRIARGNHDAYLERILSGIGFKAGIEKEIMLSDAALMHGNALPSEEAVMKDYIICGHGHIAAQVNGVDKKAWLVARAGTAMGEHYEDYNKDIELIAAPAFNRLIIGSRIGHETGEHMPLLNSGLFDLESAKAYDLYGNLLNGTGAGAILD